MIDEEKVKIAKNIAKRTLCSLLSSVVVVKTAGTIQSLTNFRAVEEYKKVVSDFADLLEDNGYNNPKEIFDCYNYALWNGYLSNNHQLNYSLDRKIYLKDSGIGCVLGESVCLNNANMLEDIYDEMGYKSYTINCYVDPKNCSITPTGSNANIERNVKENTITKIAEILNNLLLPLQS